MQINKNWKENSKKDGKRLNYPNGLMAIIAVKIVLYWEIHDLTYCFFNQFHSQLVILQQNFPRKTFLFLILKSPLLIFSLYVPLFARIRRRLIIMKKNIASGSKIELGENLSIGETGRLQSK